MVTVTTRALGILAMGGLMACQANAGASSEKLQAYVGMTASEFNGQDLVKTRNRPLSTAGTAWTGLDGGFQLKTRLANREIEFPIAGVNGGIQLSAWRGIDGTFSEPQINTIAFTVEPQNLPYESALQKALSYCAEASAAGLTVPASKNAVEGELLAARGEAAQSMNGIAACSIRNDRESFEARIVPHNSGKLDTLFRIEIAIQSHFQIAE